MLQLMFKFLVLKNKTLNIYAKIVTKKQKKNTFFIIYGQIQFLPLFLASFSLSWRIEKINFECCQHFCIVTSALVGGTFFENLSVYSASLW